MRIILTIFYACLLALASCKKKEPAPANDEPVTPVVPADSTYACRELPPVPVPFGWQDSTVSEDQNINAFFINPLNGNEVVYLVNGDLFGYNKMYCLNIPTGQAKYLGSVGYYLPHANSRGWIVFSTLDNNVFKIKVNGDSLTQLTFTNRAHDPKWDHSGNSIYFFQTAFNNTPAQLMRMNSHGAITATLPLDLAYYGVFKKSDKLIVQKNKDNTVTLILKDMVSATEKALISAPLKLNGHMYFDNLALDNNDENFYWSNDAGIFKCNLATLKIDTLKKNCANVIYDNPILVSWTPHEMNLSCHLIKPLNAATLLHRFKALQYNLFSGEVSELKVFP